MVCSAAMIQHSFVSMAPALSPLPLLTHHTPVTKAGVGSLATLDIHKLATRIIITHKPHYISLSHTTPHTLTHDPSHPHSSQLRLEEQQRARRHKREAAATKAAQVVANGNHEEAARFEKEATYTPRWFKKEFDPLTQTMMHVYKGGYREAKLRGDWSGLPNIF